MRQRPGKSSRPHGPSHRGGGKAAPQGASRSSARPPRGDSVPQVSQPRPSVRPANARLGTRPAAWTAQKGERLTIGIHSVREALKVRPKAVRILGLRDDYLRAPQLKEIFELAEAAGVAVKAMPNGELDSVGSGHQGAAAIVTEIPSIDREDLRALESCVILACDGLEDPANLGAVMRSAWLLGVKAILIPQDRAVGLTVATSKVASGGAEHVPVEAVSNLPRELQEWRDAGFWIFGLAEKGKAKAWDMKIPKKVVWVLGSESSGLRITVERACDELVQLPQVAGGSSFNAAVSASMALYETCRQHANMPTK